MPIRGVVEVVALLGLPLGAQVQRFLPTSQVVMVASMAARDEGYRQDSGNVFLDVLRTKDGKEPYPGYSSIGLYQSDHLIRSYSIRTDTGDVVDATSCVMFRYPDLLKFKRRLMTVFGSREASLDQIGSEVGCDRLRVVTHRAPANRHH